MSFVKLENLNDFIQPSTTCIKPHDKKVAGVVAKVNDVNLSDCLACSGCITSAETVLVQQQNHEELFRVINDCKVTKTVKEIVVSLSLQSITSLAHKYSITPQEAAERIASFFISIGCHRVYDINLARHIALSESYQEFKRRQLEKSTNKSPIISSVCPGWICYAEKTNGDLIIPHLSKVRSPQQIMGAILKEVRSVATGKPKSDIYHVTLMPCFDKKLEASRTNFKYGDEDGGGQDVDCVLTPIELEEILNGEGVVLTDLEPRKLDILLETGIEFDTPLTSHFGSVSGGYAENILLAEASEILDGTDEFQLRGDLEYTVLRNSDFVEVTLKKLGENANHESVRRFAIINGFRNIQTVVQRLKRNALKYDYIEIMACPTGCINGGAQCKPNYGEGRNETIRATKKLYDDISKVKLSLKSCDLKDKLRAALGGDQQARIDIDKLFYTEFQPVPKMQNLTVSW